MATNVVNLLTLIKQLDGEQNGYSYLEWMERSSNRKIRRSLCDTLGMTIPPF